MQALLAGPRAGLVEVYGSTEAAEQAVLDAIANPSPYVTHGVTVLDADLEATGDRLPVNVDAGGDVSWDYRPADPDRATQIVEVRRRAALTLAGDVDDDLLLSNLFRVWTEHLHPDGTPIRFDLITGVATLPPKNDDGKVITRRLEVRPREHLFQARELDDAVTVTAAEDVLDHIRADLLDVFGIADTAFPAPEGASTLGEDRYFPAGTSYAAKWRLMLAGIAYDQVTTTASGTPTAQPLAVLASRGPEWEYGPGAGRVVIPGSVTSLEPSLPNSLRYEARNGPTLGATLGNGLVIVLNQSDGPSSLDQRGFPVWRSIAAEAIDQPELEAFAAADSQRWFAGGGLRWSGRVGLNPLHDERDVIELIRPRLGLSGVWNAVGWRYPLKRMTSSDAALMDLTCEYRVTPTMEEAA